VLERCLAAVSRSAGVVVRTASPTAAAGPAAGPGAPAFGLPLARCPVRSAAVAGAGAPAARRQAASPPGCGLRHPCLRRGIPAAVGYRRCRRMRRRCVLVRPSSAAPPRVRSVGGVPAAPPPCRASVPGCGSPALAIPGVAAGWRASVPAPAIMLAPSNMHRRRGPRLEFPAARAGRIQPAVAAGPGGEDEGDGGDYRGALSPSPRTPPARSGWHRKGAEG